MRVTDYQDLECAALILLKLPDSEVPRIVSELCETGLPFAQISFVLCESWLTADALIPLKRKGAQIASLLNVGPLSQNCFVVEGDRSAARKTKRFLERGGARAIELRPGTKPLYFAANLLSTAIPIPVLQLAQQALRASGVEGNDLTYRHERVVGSLGTTGSKRRKRNLGRPIGRMQRGRGERAFPAAGRGRSASGGHAAPVVGFGAAANVQTRQKPSKRLKPPAYGVDLPVCSTSVTLDSHMGPNQLRHAPNCAGHPPGCCGASAS